LIDHRSTARETDTEKKKKKKKKKKKFIVHRKTNNTNSDVTTCTKVLCRAAGIAETITAGRPTYIKLTQAVNNPPHQPNPRKPKTTHTAAAS